MAAVTPYIFRHAGQGAFTCAHCDARDVGTYAAGYATVDGAPLCHPNVNRPDCYRLVTLHRHPMPCGCTIRAPGGRNRLAA